MLPTRLTSSPQNILHHPRSVNSRGLPLANRPLHSMAHITDSLAPQLLQHLHIRCVPPLLAMQTVPRQIRCTTSPSHHHPGRDGSPGPPWVLAVYSNQQNDFHPMSPRRAHSRSQSDLLQQNSIRYPQPWTLHDWSLIRLNHD